MTTTPLTRPGSEQLGGAFKVVGTSPAHHDFVDKVKGTVTYAADWQLPGMLHGKIVRSQVPSARIVSIDTSEARALPGTVVVLTAVDVPNNKVIELAAGGLGELQIEMPVLASDRVRYQGEPIALIAATSPLIAEEAAELVMVEYEDLPSVYDVESALAADAPQVHDAGNTLVTWHINHGDLQAGFAEADVVVEGTYQSQHVEHAYLEPEAGVGWIENGVVTLRVSTQVIEHASTIAEILDLPASRVRVIATYMGGGFGGKEDMTVEPYVALLTWCTKRPIRMIWSRQESLMASTKRHPFLMKYRTGVRNDGTITAMDVDILGDAGAYPLLSPRVLFAGAALACGPYRVPNASVRSRPIFTNNVPSSAFRGFGAMQVVLGYESQMNRIAEELGLTREEVRLRNFLSQGDTIITGETLKTSVGLTETLRRAISGLGDQSAPSGPNKRVGRGLACNRAPYGRTIWFRDHASSWLSIQRDGTLLIRSGITDLGAGQAASLCQIASEVLGVPLEEISIYIGDSALNPPAGGTFATRQLYMSGNAVLHTATELKTRIAPVAAELLGVDVDELAFEDGMVRVLAADREWPVSSDPDITAIVRDAEREFEFGRPAAAPPAVERPAMQGLSLAQLVLACEQRGISTSHLSTWRAEGGTFDTATGQGETFPDYTYGTHAAEVEVDLETGEVKVLKYVASHDVGRAINPLRVTGQIQGGVVQGLGYALMEELALDEGLHTSTLFANYLIPSAADFPDIKVDFIEGGDGKGPLGARGIGEPPIGNVAATIASAIHEAIGVCPHRLPMTPERVLALIDSYDADHPGREMTP